MNKKITLAILTTFAICLNGVAQEIKFTKTVIDPTYVSAGVTAADIDKDGLIDIVAGDVWYKAPNWERKEIRPLRLYYGTLEDPANPRTTEGSNYARSIGNYTKDVDGDGWLDVITLNSQDAPAYWYRNPAGNFDQLWQEYLAIEMFHNESPRVVDLFSDGDPVLLLGHHLGNNKFSLSWFSVPEDPTELWTPHMIGHPDNFAYSRGYRTKQHYAPAGAGHGLGVGDIDGDGIMDILAGQGWYKGPENGREKKNWSFMLAPYDAPQTEDGRPLEFSHMYADDFDGDGDNDVIAGAAHNYGIWWFEQIQKDGKIDFIRHEIRMDLSQVHSMNAADLDGDGKREYVAGKRYLAHLGRDPGSSDPAYLVLASPQKGADGKTEVKTYMIDEDSGAGTQIWITDLNNDKKPDIVTSNKKGTAVFIQQ